MFNIILSNNIIITNLEIRTNLISKYSINKLLAYKINQNKYINFINFYILIDIDENISFYFFVYIL
jgi:hypothetical protein